MKKAQSAMEFLMTYGWAILIVMLAMIGLQYFGVLNFKSLLPNTCNFAAGVSCRDFQLSEQESTVAFVFKNNIGRTINTIKVSIPGCVGFSYEGVFKNKDQFMTVVQDCPFTNGKLGAQPTFIYTNNATGLSHIITGSIAGSVGNGRGVSTGKSAYTNVLDCPGAASVDCRTGPASLLNGACFYDNAVVGTLCAAGSKNCDKYGNCI